MTQSLLQQALDALKNSCDFVFKDLAKAHLRDSAIAALEAAIAQPVQPASTDKHWCETCDGGGTIDETLGGEYFSNPKAECPDCDGKGYWIPRSQPVQPDAGDVNITQLRAVIESLLPFFEGIENEGPPGEGWKSDALVAAIQNAEAALAGAP